LPESESEYVVEEKNEGDLFFATEIETQFVPKEPEMEEVDPVMLREEQAMLS